MRVPVPDTRPLFRPLRDDLIKVLSSLSATDWERPTLAPAWRVRDVVAHMVDTALRRLSYHRDRLPPPSAPQTRLASERDLAALVNELNASWVRAARRFSPRVLTDLYGAASAALCDFIESLPDDLPALFPVSWAGERESEGLLDIGREFTEVWHHGAQIREAVGAGPFTEPRWLRAVLAIAVRALPHAYRDVPATVGATVGIEITGEAGGTWMLVRGVSGWDLTSPVDSDVAARAVLSDDVAWRLFFNALREPAGAVRISGDVALARPLLRTRSVIV